LAVAAVTLDFGNTLVPVDRARHAQVVDDLAAGLLGRGTIDDVPAFLGAWAVERERQFREEVPQFREVTIAERLVRVLARLRGMPAPGDDLRWDDAAAARLSDPPEIAAALDDYSASFVARMPPDPAATTTLRALASSGFRVGILSNWPLAATIDRYVEATGWTGWLAAVVVSQRVGVIKPHPAIFRAAELALGFQGEGAAERIVHVGDDWAADVVGARNAGWHAAYLRGRQDDTPLPTSEPGDHVPGVARNDVRADFEIDDLAELPDALELAAGRAA
jgi:FMN phosphatase YigB (HAD superfamily)